MYSIRTITMDGELVSDHSIGDVDMVTAFDKFDDATPAREDEVVQLIQDDLVVAEDADW